GIAGRVRRLHCGRAAEMGGGRQSRQCEDRLKAGRKTQSLRPHKQEECPMARIVLGLGTSHTPMLLASDETLPRFLETDRTIKHRDKEGRPATYGDPLETADPKP